MAKTNIKSISSNILWSVIERFSSQIAYLVVSVILARLIMPEVYGIVTIVSVIINIFSIGIQSGFSSSLIYADEVDIRHYSTAFWSTLFITGVLYIGLFFAAPFIASYYEAPEISAYIRVMAIQFVLQGIQSIPFAYVSKNMLFRKNYVATFIGVIVSAAVSIILAANGLEPWALVLMTSTEVLVATVILWILLKFKIEFTFDFAIAKSMAKYCWKLVGVDVFNALYSSLNSMIIGKRFSKSKVAYYNKAYSLPQAMLGSVNTAISKVLFPVFSESKSSKDDIRDMLRRSIRTIHYVVFPLLMGMAVLAKEAVTILYTEKWLGVVPYLQVMCVVWMLQPIQTSVIQAFKALGKSDIYLKLEILKKICGLVVLVALMFIMDDAISLAWALLGSQLISSVINMPILKKYLDYRYRTQIFDALDSVLLTLVMAAATWGVGLLMDGVIIKAIIQVVAGIAVYVGLSVVTKNKNFNYMFDLLIALLPKRQSKSGD